MTKSPSVSQRRVWLVARPGGFSDLYYAAELRAASRHVAHTLTFEVTFSGAVEDCATRDRVFTGDIDVVVDGSVVAAKPTRITVPACKFTYAVKFVSGVQTDCGCVCSPVRPGSQRK